MGIRAKILSGFTILIIMLFLAGIWSIYELRSVGSSVQRLLDDNYKSIDAAKMMIEALEREDSAVLLLLLGKWEEGRAIVQSGDELFKKGFEIANSNITIPGERDLVDRIEEKYRAYRNIWTRPIVGTKYEADLNWYFEGLHQAFLDTKASVNRLMALNAQNMYRTASDLKERAHRATMPGIVAIISALAFTLIFNYFVNLYVVNPIIKMTKAIHQFIETSKPLDIQVDTRDELSELLSSVQQLIAMSKR